MNKKRKYIRKKTVEELPVKKVNEQTFRIIKSDTGEIALLLPPAILHEIILAMRKDYKPSRSKDDPFYKLSDKTVKFFKDVVNAFGTDVKIDRFDRKFEDIHYAHRIPNPSPTLIELAKRNLISLSISKRGKRKQIEYFIIKYKEQKGVENV